VIEPIGTEPLPIGSSPSATRARAVRVVVLVAVLVFGARVPFDFLLGEWLAHQRGGYGDPSARLEQIAAKLPYERFDFVSDVTDPGDSAYRFYLVQYALAPRRVEPRRASDPVAHRARYAVAWLSPGVAPGAVPALQGMDIVADAGGGIVVVAEHP
jgi:hypothetical protein